MKTLVLIAMVFGLVLCGTGNIYAQFPHPPWVKAAPVEVTNSPTNPVNVTGTVMTTSPCCYRFVGFSKDVTAGGLHPTGMTALCEATYSGRSARMCTTAEVLNTNIGQDMVPQDLTVAWVNPTSYQFVYLPLPSEDYYPFYAFDTASGVSTGVSKPDEWSWNLSCRNWSLASETNTGMVMDYVHGFMTVPCAASVKVACCAP